MQLTYLAESQGAIVGASLPSASFARSGEPSWGVIYSGVRFGSDGDVYARQLGGGWGRVGTWLFNGTNSDFHIHRTVNSGTLTTDAGDDLVMSSNRDYDIQNSTPSSTVTASVTFRISNVADSETYDTIAYAFSAQMESP